MSDFFITISIFFVASFTMTVITSTLGMRYIQSERFVSFFGTVLDGEMYLSRCIIGWAILTEVFWIVLLIGAVQWLFKLF